MYQFAIGLIRKGLAYVCELSPEQMKEIRAISPTPPSCPFGTGPLRKAWIFLPACAPASFQRRHDPSARIDPASGNFNLRDPAIYRINHTSHHRTGDTWCIYPMYDYAHPIEDAWRGSHTPSVSLELKTNRPLYDWVIRI